MEGQVGGSGAMDTQGRGPSAAPAGGGSSSAGSLEELLVTLRKSSRDLSFYPPAHPLLARSLERALDRVRAEIGGRLVLSFGVTRGGFQVEGRAVGAENPQLADMAADLFLRRIQQVGFGTGIEVGELTAFLRIATADPKTLLEQGGPAKVLASQGVSRIQITELEFRRTEPAGSATPPGESRSDSDPSGSSDEEGATPAPGEPPTAVALLQRLEHEAAAGGTAGYEWAASRLHTVAASAVQADRLAEVVAILRAFLGHRERAGLAEPIRQRAAKAVETIANTATLEYLSDRAGHEGGEAAGDPSDVLVALGSLVVPGVVSRVATADRGPVRERLIGLVLALRHTALPDLVGALKGVDRELGYDLAAGLRGCPDQGSMVLLARFLRHKAVWVRGEALRTLAGIGGDAATRLVLQALGDPDAGVVELAIGHLGAMQVKQATPSLLRFATKPVLKGKAFALRLAAVAALGAMGDRGCIPVLQRILRTRTWFRRSAGEELRRAAASALLALGRPEARSLVETGARGRWRRDVRRACTAALHPAEPRPAPKAAAERLNSES
jgi:hypothetical protein